jgi:DNA polymerase (family X)
VAAGVLQFRLAGAVVTNQEIAEKLLALAQLLAAKPKNLYKVKAYRRAAKTLQRLGESVEELVRSGADLRQFSGIGDAISGAIREIVQTGTLKQIDSLHSQVTPELATLSEYPLLDPQRVLRIYKKLQISSLDALKEELASGAILKTFGVRMEQHVRRAFAKDTEMLWYDADVLVTAVHKFLTDKCGVHRAKAVGSYRRKLEVVNDISFLIETDDFPSVVAKLEGYGGKAEVLSTRRDHALFKLSSGVLLDVRAAKRANWGLALIRTTGSDEHLRQLEEQAGDLQTAEASTEAAVYRNLRLSFIPPELREGHDEIAFATLGQIPALAASDIRGELHCHTTASDGANTIEEMATAARELGYEYIGISDHSQSLKIAGGLSVEDLWEQIRFIDELNERLDGIHLLKSAEVDILADGSLDYPDELLRELDYTVCSIHSRFGLGKTEQTERILRAMDNRYFNILGHATGRLLLKRPGYEIDVDRVIEHARQTKCYFEMNSSPDRLDLSAAHARLARQAGVKVAITTDAHSTREFRYLEFGVHQARRAGFDKASILNHADWDSLVKMLKR